MSPRHNEDDSTPTDELMSPQETARRIRQIHRALMGDPYDKDNPGLVNQLRDLSRDYYGDEQRKLRGTKEMVETLWDLRIRILGAAAALGVVGSLAGWLIEKLLFK